MSIALTEVLAGFLTNMVSDEVSSKFSQEDLKSKIQKIIDKSIREYHEKYPVINGTIDDSFLFSSTNDERIINWILEANNSINCTEPVLDLINFNGIEEEEENVKYFFERIKYHVKRDDDLRSLAIFEFTKNTQNIANQIYEILSDDSNYAKKFVEQLHMLDQLFYKKFNCSIWSTNLRLDYINYTFNKKDKPIAICFNNLNMLFDSLNKTQFNEITGHNILDGLESLISLFKITFAYNSHELNDIYTSNLKNIRILTRKVSLKDGEYYNALGQLHIDFDCDEEKIYKKVMEELIKVNSKLNSILSDFFKQHDFLKIENQTNKKINENIEQDIEHLLARYPETLKYIKIIHEKGRITDSDLADLFSISISELRSELYPLIGSLITYQYNSGSTTTISIIHYCRSVIHECL